MHHNLIIHDDGDGPITDSLAAHIDVDYPEFTVIAEGGIFKHGRLYAAGETIKLHPDTAARFIDLGEVE